MRQALFISVSILGIAVAILFLKRIRPADLQTSDFINFYAAGSIVRRGDSATLYTRETQNAAFHSLLGYATTQYFLHPPFEAAGFALFSYLPIQNAFIVWTLINVALLGILPAVLKPAVPLISSAPYFGILGLAFLPVLIALSLGQDSVLLLFIYGSCYALLVRRRDAAAGAVLALAAIKFQYLVVFLPLILAWRKFRFLAGFLAGSLGLACVSAITVGMKGLLTYFTFLRSFEVHSGYGSLNPTLMVNWRGFLAGTGLTAHLAAYTLFGSFALLALGFACTRVQAEHATNLVFAICLTISLTASPYTHFPDASLLLLSILIVLDHVHGPQRSYCAKLAQSCCALLFLWPWLLLALGGHYWWNSRIYLVFPVLLLFLLAIVAVLHHENRTFGQIAAA